MTYCGSLDNCSVFVLNSGISPKLFCTYFCHPHARVGNVFSPVCLPTEKGILMPRCTGTALLPSGSTSPYPAPASNNPQRHLLLKDFAVFCKWTLLLCTKSSNSLLSPINLLVARGKIGNQGWPLMDLQCSQAFPIQQSWFFFLICVRFV